MGRLSYISSQDVTAGQFITRKVRVRGLHEKRQRDWAGAEMGLYLKTVEYYLPEPCKRASRECQSSIMAPRNDVSLLPQ